MKIKRKITPSEPLEYDDMYVFPALVLPYGGHKAGNLDCHGQRFTPDTDFKTELLPFPPVIYAHGMPIDEGKVADRVIVGKTINRWYDGQGGWATLGIYKGTALTDEVMASYRNGTLKFSSSALIASLNKTNRQSYDLWLAGEFSVVTDKTPLPACNLLTRAETYGKMAIDAILAELPEDNRATLEELLKEAGAADDDQPAGGEGDGEDLEDFGDGAEGDEMKPEELTAAISTALQPLADRVAALEAAPPPGDKQVTQPAGGGKQKTETPEGVDPELLAMIEDKATRSKTDAGVYAVAGKLVDGYVAEGKISPEERLGMIGLATAAINGDGRKKTEGGALSAFMAMVDGRGKMAVDPKSRLSGFGAGITDPALGANADDVAAMIKAGTTD